MIAAAHSHFSVGSFTRIMVVAAVIWSTCASARNRVDLPVEVALDTPRVELDLSDARVEISIGTENAPRLAARLAEPDTDTGVFLEAALSPRVVTQIWRITSESIAPQIVVEIDLTPDQVLIVAGNRLDLAMTQAVANSEPGASVAGAGPETLDTADTVADAQNLPKTTVDVSDTVFFAKGLEGLSLTAVRGSCLLEAITEKVEIDLLESELLARRLHGPTIVSAIDSTVTIEDCEGAVSFEVEGGVLAATGGSSNVQGTINNGDIEVTAMSGKAVINGTNASLRITNSTDLAVQIDGTDLRATLDEVGGPIRAVLTGGDIAAGRIGARFDLQLAARAEAELQDLDGDFAMVIRDGSRATVDRVAGHTRIRLEESDLEVSDLKSFELDARGGSVSGSEVHKLSRVETDGTDLDLSLSAVNQKHSIALKGLGTAIIHLPEPCRVVGKMPDTTAGDQLRVTGCLLDFDGSRKWGIRRGIDGQAPILLNATLDDVASLEVHGHP